MNKKTKLTLLIAVGVTLALALCFGIGVSAANYINENLSRDGKHQREGNRFEKEGNRVIAQIDSIDGRSVTVTVGEIERTNDSNESDSSSEKDITKDFKATDETLKLTAPEDIDLDGFEAGTIVMLSYNDDNEITRIKDASEVKEGKLGDKRNFTVASIDSIDGSTIVLTLGSLERPEKDDSTQKDTESVDPTESFIPGEEKLTLTVTDSELISGFKAGDIVSITYNSEENTLTNIRLLSDLPEKGMNQRGNRMGKQRDFSSNQNNGNSENKNQNKDQTNASINQNQSVSSEYKA